MIRLILSLIFLALPALAEEEIVLGLSHDQVAITATFEGSDILVFGAIKREVPIPDQSHLGVIVTIAGPDRPVDIWRKDRVAGIWVNTQDVEVDAAPSFYAVATSAPMRDVLNHVEDLNYRITTPRTIKAIGGQVSDSLAFMNALIRIRTDAGLYQRLEGAIDLEEDTLFRTAITLPANLTEGTYEARIFLTRNGRVIDEYTTEIPVRKVGLERWLYNLAHEHALLYGIMSLILAISAGWGASAIFGMLRR
ncbi:TIGR02186 family protein [Loktanella sp. S4079]|uniref:TIGR02186 family protein n=1 Tax=Loktanella sp. S4079 TaxID=579483 RepID=UPI0005F9BD37|nr:TIGR02186 family protein [Loktanella sp. S4079]KJZ20825.1 membrane protein [Loktanella sp. S4079]